MTSSSKSVKNKSKKIGRFPRFLAVLGASSLVLPVFSYAAAAATTVTPSAQLAKGDEIFTASATVDVTGSLAVSGSSLASKIAANGAIKTSSKYSAALKIRSHHATVTTTTSVAPSSSATVVAPSITPTTVAPSTTTTVASTTKAAPTAATPRTAPSCSRRRPHRRDRTPQEDHHHDRGSRHHNHGGPHHHNHGGANDHYDRTPKEDHDDDRGSHHHNYGDANDHHDRDAPGVSDWCGQFL